MLLRAPRAPKYHKIIQQKDMDAHCDGSTRRDAAMPTPGADGCALSAPGSGAVAAPQDAPSAGVLVKKHPQLRSAAPGAPATCLADPLVDGDVPVVVGHARDDGRAERVHATAVGLLGDELVAIARARGLDVQWRDAPVPADHRPIVCCHTMDVPPELGVVALGNGAWTPVVSLTRYRLAPGLGRGHWAIRGIYRLPHGSRHKRAPEACPAIDRRSLGDQSRHARRKPLRAVHPPPAQDPEKPFRELQDSPEERRIRVHARVRYRDVA